MFLKNVKKKKIEEKKSLGMGETYKIWRKSVHLFLL